MPQQFRPYVLALFALAALTGCPGDEKPTASASPGVAESHVPAAAASVGAATSPGQTLFQNRCQSCHGVNGGGGMGPSLVKVGQRLKAEQIEATIEKGRPANGMPAFEGVLLPADIRAVRAYVQGL